MRHLNSTKKNFLDISFRGCVMALNELRRDLYNLNEIMKERENSCVKEQEEDVMKEIEE